MKLWHLWLTPTQLWYIRIVFINVSVSPTLKTLVTWILTFMFAIDLNSSIQGVPEMFIYEYGAFMTNRHFFLGHLVVNNLYCSIKDCLRSIFPFPHKHFHLCIWSKAEYFIDDIKEDFKKTEKWMTLCKKGGRCQKKSNFECVNKSDILQGEGGGAKLMSLFSRCFSSDYFRIFSAHPLTFLHFIVCFLSIFDISNNFIIDFW